MKWKTKALCSILAATMLFAGCASGEGGDASGSGSSGAPASSGTDSGEPITFPLPEKQTLTAFVITPFSGSNGDYQDNWVTNILEEEENIKIDFQTCTSGEDGKTKLNLLMASGDTLPDILLTTKWSKAETLLYGCLLYTSCPVLHIAAYLRSSSLKSDWSSSFFMLYRQDL